MAGSTIEDRGLVTMAGGDVMEVGVDGARARSRGGST